jgi:hypothetical protein
LKEEKFITGVKNVVMASWIVMEKLMKLVLEIIVADQKRS